MPWKEIRVQEQRLLVVREHLEGASIAELSEIYAVSRKTIYKWLERYEQRGPGGLGDQSRRPLHSPSQVSAEVEQAIVAARQRWRWGPGKLRVKLRESDPARQWPAVSTIAAVLRDQGLVVSRRGRPRRGRGGQRQGGRIGTTVRRACDSEPEPSGTVAPADQVNRPMRSSSLLSTQARSSRTHVRAASRSRETAAS
jgi:transposase